MHFFKGAPDGMGLELGDNLLGQQFHNSKILETARNARTAKETKPPCANEDKSSSLGIFAQGGYLAGPGGGDEDYPRKLFRNFGIGFLVSYNKDFGGFPNFEVMTWHLCHLQRSVMNCVQKNSFQLQISKSFSILYNQCNKR
ncbi:hypothetical protein [Alistipes sp. An31A]|uniref:hypothetical protein n=1 Tax=Alistipes sp. An31A TaxID=1965631 RepID=UPI00117781EB|nr:hypothetical protein [Alistipes sp. An31A]